MEMLEWAGIPTPRNTRLAREKLLLLAPGRKSWLAQAAGGHLESNAPTRVGDFAAALLGLALDVDGRPSQHNRLAIVTSDAFRVWVFKLDLESRVDWYNKWGQYLRFGESRPPAWQQEQRHALAADSDITSPVGLGDIPPRARSETRAVHPVSAGLEARSAIPDTKSELVLSTGAAVERVIQHASKSLAEGRLSSLAELESNCGAVFKRLRGVAFPFLHFLRVGPGYPLATWSRNDDPEAAELRLYLDGLLEHIRKANHAVGDQLGRRIVSFGPSRIYVTEYSRAILSGLQRAPWSGHKPPRPKIFIVDRAGATIREEAHRAAAPMREAGYEVDYLTPTDWLDALQNSGRDKTLVLFGAEAFIRKGVVFPQILSEPERNGLRNFMASAGPRGRIWCAAEAYKLNVADDDNELRETYMNANYSELPASLFHSLITDHGEISVAGDVFDWDKVLSHSMDMTREITREALAGRQPAGRCLPFDCYPDRDLAQVAFVVADIDDTITGEAKKIPHQVLEDLVRLNESSVRVVLATGRPGGWAQALACYAPGVDCVLGENGCCAYVEGGERLAGFSPQPLAQRAELEELAKKLCRDAGWTNRLLRTNDDPYRLHEVTFVRPTDWANADVTVAESRLPDGFELVASSIHLHLRRRGWGKGKGAAKAIELLSKGRPGADVTLAIGDSANDASLFAEFVSTSVGVANVLAHLEELKPDTPRYVTKTASAGGFLEVISRLLTAKAHR